MMPSTMQSDGYVYVLPAEDVWLVVAMGESSDALDLDCRRQTGAPPTEEMIRVPITQRAADLVDLGLVWVRDLTGVLGKTTCPTPLVRTEDRITVWAER